RRPAGWCSGRAATPAVEPLCDLVRVEAQQVSPLDVGDAALGHEPTDMPLVDAQVIGHLLEGEQLRPAVRPGRDSSICGQADLRGSLDAPPTPAASDGGPC